MGGLFRFNRGLVDRFLSPALPQRGAQAQSVEGGEGLSFGPMVTTPSAESLARGDAALARIAATTWRDVSERSRHRLGDVVLLAKSAAENDCLPHALASTQALREWIAQDRYGEAAAWEHSSDVAWRTMRFSLLLSLLKEDLEPEARLCLAGSVQLHALHLRHALLSSGMAHPRRAVLQASALVLAGLTWPRLQGARQWWSEGLTCLGRSLPAVLGEDGSPSEGLGDLVECMEAASLARAACCRKEIAFPSAADGPLIQGISFLRVLEGEHCPLRISSFDAPWGQGDRPRSESLWNALVGWGLVADDSSERAATDSIAEMLCGDELGAGRALAPPNGWRMSALRQGGWVAAHGGTKAADLSLRWRFKDVEGRGPNQPEWGTAGTEILADCPQAGVFRPATFTKSRIENARVDGRLLQVHVHFESTAGDWHRKVSAEGARLVFLDRLTGEKGLQVDWIWQLAPSWSQVENEEPGRLRSGERCLRVSLPNALEWHWEQHPEGLRAKASGWVAPGNLLQTGFELGK